MDYKFTGTLTNSNDGENFSVDLHLPVSVKSINQTFTQATLWKQITTSDMKIGDSISGNVRLFNRTSTGELGGNRLVVINFGNEQKHLKHLTPTSNLQSLPHHTR